MCDDKCKICNTGNNSTQDNAKKASPTPASSQTDVGPTSTSVLQDEKRKTMRQSTVQSTEKKSKANRSGDGSNHRLYAAIGSFAVAIAGVIGLIVSSILDYNVKMSEDRLKLAVIQAREKGVTEFPDVPEVKRTSPAENNSVEQPVAFHQVSLASLFSGSKKDVAAKQAVTEAQKTAPHPKLSPCKVRNAFIRINAGESCRLDHTKLPNADYDMAIDNGSSYSIRRCDTKEEMHFGESEQELGQLYRVTKGNCFDITVHRGYINLKYTK